MEEDERFKTQVCTALNREETEMLDYLSKILCISKAKVMRKALIAYTDYITTNKSHNIET